MKQHQVPVPEPQAVRIPVGGVTLNADLTQPSSAAEGIVVFAHGSGSSRLSPRNRWVADQLVQRGLATLLMDLLTEAEDRVDRYTREYRFDIPRLATRLIGANDWLAHQPGLVALPMGYFGASTGAAAALIAAAEQPSAVSAVVSRGGRPDMAEDALRLVRAPTLLIVGGNDRQVIELNRRAAAAMEAPVSIEIVPGATHLFEEPGKLERVAELAGDWFRHHLAGTAD